MRIAIHNPQNLSPRKNHDLYGYVLEFVKKYRPYIYLHHKKKPLRYFYRTRVEYTKQDIKKQLRNQGLEYPDSLFITDIDQLNKKVDVLLSFTGEYFLNIPEKRFKGLKIYHTNDFQDYGTQNHCSLRKNSIQMIFGTGQLDKYSPFFRKYFPSYIGKVKSFPFGFAPRFKKIKPWNKRKNKAVSLGSVNPIRNQDRFKGHEILITRNNKVEHKKITKPIDKIKFFAYYFILNTGQTRDFAHFHKGLFFVQPFRRLIVENEEKLSDIVDSKLPHYPKIKDFSFDMVKCMNDYKMVHVDDGVIEIVGAKIYEASACGCVAIVPDEPFYNEWRFTDGVNCIKYKPMNMKDFRKKVEYYQKHPKELKKIQETGYAHVTKNFTHKKIANKIYKLTKEALDEFLKKNGKK